MAARTCPCGHTRGHPEVQQEPEYTLWGWICLSMFGLTPSPERIVFRCIRCKRSLGSSRDPALLHKKRMPDAQSRTTTTAESAGAAGTAGTAGTMSTSGPAASPDTAPERQQ